MCRCHVMVSLMNHSTAMLRSIIQNIKKKKNLYLKLAEHAVAVNLAKKHLKLTLGDSIYDVVLKD